MSRSFINTVSVACQDTCAGYTVHWRHICGKGEQANRGDGLTTSQITSISLASVKVNFPKTETVIWKNPSIFHALYWSTTEKDPSGLQAERELAAASKGTRTRATNKPLAHRKNKNHRLPRPHLADLVSLLTSCQVSAASLCVDRKRALILLRGGCGGSKTWKESIDGSKGREPVFTLSDDSNTKALEYVVVGSGFRSAMAVEW